MSSYFDDFPTLEMEQTCKSAKAALEGLLRILGWEYVQEEHKYAEYAKEFKVLGVLMDLTGQEVVLKNVPERLQNIQELCDLLLHEPTWRKHSVDKLLGRCSFARAYLMGRQLSY